MDRKKVISVIAILTVFVLVVGAYYGVIPTVMNNNSTEAGLTAEESKAVLEGIPTAVTLTNTSQTSYKLTVTGVSGTTTDVFLMVIDAPTNVSVYFTTTSSSHWSIKNNGTVAEYKGFPIYAGDIIDDLILHIDASGEPSHGKVSYDIHSNDVLVIKNSIETEINS